MKKNRFLWAFVAAVVGMGGLLTSCNPEEPNSGPDNTGDGSYVISAAAGDANYLVQAEALDNGNITVLNTGYETNTGTAWLFYKDQYLYRLQYNQGNAGVTSSYQMGSNNQIEARPNEYNITRFTTYGIYGENIITVSAVDTDTKDEAGRPAQGLGFTYLHAHNETTSTKTILGENFLGNGEYVTLAGILEVNNKLYTSVVPMGLSKYGVNADGGKWVTNQDLVAKEDGGSGSGSYEEGEIPGTQYPDYAWVAIYDNSDFENPTIVKTDKMGYACGRNRSQYYQTIWADDEGNVYVFSPGFGRLTSNKYQTQGVKEAAVMRINKGATEFDANYYVNLETLSGGQPFFRCWHITGDYFLLQMYTQGLDSKGTGATKLAIYKGKEQSFNYVDGLPEADKISSFGGTPYCENGVAYMPVVTNDGSDPALYKIDPASHTATKGLTITAESVSAVGKLVAQQ